MALNEFHKVVDWDQTRTEQGSSTKTIVNMGFKNDTNLATMIGMPGIVTDELKMVLYKLQSPKKKPLAKAHALFYEDLKAVIGDESKINVENGEIQISFFVGSAPAAKYTPEREGLAGEGWNVKFSVISLYRV